ncbi:hypothetical protein [Streptomyces niger]|uniref:hypothetical protein n=1 Tax=Streptomyces niger TaxID=66373 RepID=UPI000699B3E8|nr:hypothetical protein [Streptomyces niger]
MRAQWKAAAWCGRLLLFAALVAGIVTMHTFGHPMPGEGHGNAAPMTAAPMTAAAPAAHSPAAHVPVTQAAAHDGHRHAAAPGPHGMDPGSVCLAVLSAWSCALLAAAGLLVRRRRPAGLSAAALARLLRALWPIPPPLPRHKHLARLSVLRV